MMKFGNIKKILQLALACKNKKLQSWLEAENCGYQTAFICYFNYYKAKFNKLYKNWSNRWKKVSYPQLSASWHQLAQKKLYFKFKYFKKYILFLKKNSSNFVAWIRVQKKPVLKRAHRATKFWVTSCFF